LSLVEELIEEVKALRAQVAELEAKLAKYEKTDSSNSNNPSSTDRFKKNQSQRKKSRNKSGGQNGHKGTTRLQTETPDEVIKCHPEKCSNCGTDLVFVEGRVSSVRQEFDVELPESKVVEYQQIEKICPKCKSKNKGDFPKQIRAPVQIGNNTRALSVYLHLNHKIPFGRTKEVIADLLGLEISEGTVENILDKALEETKVIHSEIMDKLKACKYINSDETGIRVEKKNYQLWTWCNEFYSYYAANKRRSTTVIEEHLGIDYQGVIIHDCHAAQNNTIAGAHQQCLVHFDRALKYAIQEENCYWSQSFYHFSLSARKIRDQVWQEDFDPEARSKIINAFHQGLDKIMEAPPNQEEGMKLYKRVLKHRNSILTFMEHPDLPADNNGAERAIRNAKIRQKVSGCFRNSEAAKRYAVILSWLETAKKQGMSALEACMNIFSGNMVLA
jgi:transposase